VAEQIFQYTTPTVQVDDYVLDAAALNAYIRRATSAYGKGNIQYCIGTNCEYTGKGQPHFDANVEMVLDCSGFAYWTTYRQGVYAHTEGPYWVRVSIPIPGSTVRYDPKSGNDYGHSGVVIAPGTDEDPGNFMTLDSTQVGNTKPPTGSIRFLRDGRSKWITKGGPNVRFLVSTEAVISKGGVPFKHTTNLLLEAAKRPITTLSLGVGALVLLGFYVFYRKKLKPRWQAQR
jgi:hypothetical protein